MPEGPEVRRHADAIEKVLKARPIEAISARTKAAREWLALHPDELIGRRIESVQSHGKNLVGLIEGGFYFYSHLMMWGRWHIVPNDGEIERDRRERARITVAESIAILMSAPVFQLGHGDPLVEVPYLAALGPDALPYQGAAAFDAKLFRERLLAGEHRERTIGAALLDQQIVAGIGNYLRAEILFACRLDPWRSVAQLLPDELARLCQVVPEMTSHAYRHSGVTTSEAMRERMKSDASLSYNEGEWHLRHAVFRRTNLPCLECGDRVRQLRQTTRVLDDEEKTRIIYFCPTCQNTSIPLKKPRVKTAKTKTGDETAVDGSAADGSDSGVSKLTKARRVVAASDGEKTPKIQTPIAKETKRRAKKSASSA